MTWIPRLPATSRPGHTKFTVNDIIFQLRHYTARVGRLRDHLRWRHIRSTAAKSSKEAGDDPGDVLLEDATAGGDRDDEKNESYAITKNANNKRAAAGAAAVDMPPVPLPWSVTFFFPYADEILRDVDLDDDNDTTQAPQLPKAAAAAAPSTRLTRLPRNDDERTRAMTSAEYHIWTEPRVSSFSHRRKATFRA